MNMVGEQIRTKSILESAGEIVLPETAEIGVKAVLEAHGLNWKVIQLPVQSSLGAIPNVRANYREDTNTFFGLVSDRYTVLNNYEAFNFIDDLEDFSFDRAGCSKDGKQVFIVGKTSNFIEIDNNDRIEEYLTFIHGHDGSHAIQLIISPLRTFCTNQLNLLLNKANFKYSIKHVGNIDIKLSQARKAIVEGNFYMKKLEMCLENLREKKINFDVGLFLDKLLSTYILSDTVSASQRINDIRNDILSNYYYKEDNQNYKGTYFGLLNAVSDYVSHQRPGKVYSKDTYTKLFLNTISNNKLLNSAYTLLNAA